MVGVPTTRGTVLKGSSIREKGHSALRYLKGPKIIHFQHVVKVPALIYQDLVHVSRVWSPIPSTLTTHSPAQGTCELRVQQSIVTVPTVPSHLTVYSYTVNRRGVGDRTRA